MYAKLTNENCHYYDVDDTLILWDQPAIDSVPLFIKNGNYEEPVYRNEKVIESLKRAKLRGHHVTVHSQGGADWAEMVVKALGLEKYVDVIKTKAKWYHDDIPADSWMTRIDER